MNQDQETYELIERYLQGALEGEELLRFEQAVEEDAALAEEVNLQRSVGNLLAENDIQALDEQLTAIGSEYATPTPKLFPFRKVWFAAAAVLVLGIASIGFFKNAGPIDGEQLYTSYFELYPADNSVRSEGDDSTQVDQLKKALDAYAKEDLEEAAKGFLGYLYLNETDARARFYLGVTLLAQGYPEKAETTLYELTEQSDSIYSDPARWYYALSLIRQGKRSSARKALQELSRNAKGKYQKLANDLLEEF